MNASTINRDEICLIHLFTIVKLLPGFTINLLYLIAINQIIQLFQLL